MKKILIVIGMLIDTILWFVFLSFVVFIAMGMVVTILYLLGIIKTEPSLIMGNLGVGIVLSSLFLSVGGVITGKLPGYVRNKKKLDRGLCSFEIEQSVEGFRVSKPKRQHVFVFKDKLAISGEKDIELTMEDIKSVGFFAGKVFLECKNKSISFIFPSYVSNVSEGTTTELFVAMLRGLKKKEDVSEIVTLIRNAKATLDKRTNVIIWLIKSSCLLFIISFIVIGKYEAIGFVFLILAFGCLVALFPVSLLFSKGDYSFGNKDRKLHYYFLLAEQCIEIIKDREGNFEEVVSQYAQEMVFIYLEKMIEVDPESDYVSIIRSKL